MKYMKLLVLIIVLGLAGWWYFSRPAAKPNVPEPAAAALGKMVSYRLDGQEVSLAEFEAVFKRLVVEEKFSEGELPGGSGFIRVYPAANRLRTERYEYLVTSAESEQSYALRRLGQ